jgi:hypothetical protein
VRERERRERERERERERRERDFRDRYLNSCKSIWSNSKRKQLVSHCCLYSFTQTFNTPE